MQLYLIRHADAVPLGEAGITSDADRPLTPKGKDQIKLLAAAMLRLGVTLDRLVTSPLVRAQETAERLRGELKLDGVEITTCEELSPGESSKDLARLLRGLEGKHVALVGHEPDLGKHTAWLIGSKRVRIEFAKAGIACVACGRPPDKGAGTLLWLLTPACCQG